MATPVGSLSEVEASAASAPASTNSPAPSTPRFRHRLVWHQLAVPTRDRQTRAVRHVPHLVPPLSHSGRHRMQRLRGPTGPGSSPIDQNIIRVKFSVKKKVFNYSRRSFLFLQTGRRLVLSLSVSVESELRLRRFPAALLLSQVVPDICGLIELLTACNCLPDNLFNLDDDCFARQSFRSILRRAGRGVVKRAL